MTSLLFSDKEMCLTRNFIDEAYRLFGIDCVVFDVTSMNMYGDDRNLSSGTPYKILLSEYVDTRLLSNLKWSTLDANREAITALAPIQYNGVKFNLREFNVIRLNNGDTYQIREVNSTYLLSTHYAIKLITYRDEKDRPREDKQMKTNYLKTTREEFE
jgi:hypothetical protein